MCNTWDTIVCTPENQSIDDETLTLLDTGKNPIHSVYWIERALLYLYFIRVPRTIEGVIFLGKQFTVDVLFMKFYL